jgi:hypothetical protein
MGIPTAILDPEPRFMASLADGWAGWERTFADLHPWMGWTAESAGDEAQLYSLKRTIAASAWCQVGHRAAR